MKIDLPWFMNCLISILFLFKYCSIFICANVARANVYMSFTESSIFCESSDSKLSYFNAAKQ